MANLKQEPVLDLDGHVVRDARKPKKAAALDRDAEIARLNEKIEFLSRTNMLYSDWEHRETQVTSDLIRKGIEEAKINVQLRAEIESLKAQLAQPESEIKSWGETHPRNPSAACSCEHWQSCVECRPTAHAQPAQEPAAWRVSPRYEDSDGFFDYTDSKDTADTLQTRGWTITPLYAQPYQLAQEPHGYDWSMLEAAKESLREHMARIKELEAALKQALEALETSTDWNVNATGRQLKSMQAITALRTALAQPEQEPVAWISQAMTSAEKAIDVAIKLEREACAKVCDSFQARDVGMQPAECAGAIRARGEQE